MANITLRGIPTASTSTGAFVKNGPLTILEVDDNFNRLNTAVINAAVAQTIILTGDVTGSGTGSFAATIGAGKVTLAKMADVNTATVFYRKTLGDGPPEVRPLSTLKSDLGLTGTNSGDQTIMLTGDVIGTGTGSIVAAIGVGKVTNTMLAGGISLTTKVTDVLPVVNGGTGRNTTSTAYGIITAGASTTAAHNTLAAGSTNQILVSRGSSAYPDWTSTLISPTLTTPKFVDNGYIADSAGNELLKFNSNASAANFVVIENSATGIAPAIRANGSDSNVDLTLEAKGTGDVLVTSGSFGYGAGGGSVTQTTSKITGVTLNKSCGQINLFSHNTEDRDEEWNFTLTNNKISANDVVVCSLKTSGGGGAYIPRVVETDNGICTIRVYCTDGPSDPESPILNFVVIKAVNS